MTIETKKTVAGSVMEIKGRLDTTTAPSLEKEVEKEMAAANSIIFDLKELEYISSAGLRVILSTQKKIKDVGDFKLINVQESVMEVLEITGFVDILTIE